MKLAEIDGKNFVQLKQLVEAAEAEMARLREEGRAELVAKWETEAQTQYGCSALEVLDSQKRKRGRPRLVKLPPGLAS